MSEKSLSFSPANTYGRVGLHSEVNEASPHRLVQMLMEGALKRLSIAKASMERGKIAEKGENIGVAIDIVQTLQASLNYEEGGDVAVQLGQLYDYCLQKLIESRHITRSRKVDKKLERLLEDSEKRNAMAQASSALVSFNIKIHGYYIVHGFAQSKKIER